MEGGLRRREGRTGWDGRVVGVSRSVLFVVLSCKERVVIALLRCSELSC